MNGEITRTGARTSAVVRMLLVVSAFMPAYLAERAVGHNAALAAWGYAIAFLMVLAASAWRREKRIPFHFPAKDHHLRSRAWWLVPSVALAALSFNAVLSQRVSDSVALRLWLLSLACLILPFWIRPSRREEVPKEEPAPATEPPIQRRRNRKLEIGAVVVLLAVALSYRLPALERYPIMVHNDSASCGLMARKLVEEIEAGHPQWFRLRAFYEYPTLGFIPYIPFQMMFSRTLFAHRLVNVVGSMVGLLCLYLLVRALLGVDAGLLTLGLAAAGHFAVHWSRDGISCGQAAAMMVICPWLLWKAVSTGKVRWFILAGVLLPVCFLTYQSALVVPAWLGLVVAIFWVLSGRFRRRYTVPVLVMALSALVFFAPMTAVYAKNPKSFISRRSSMIFSDFPSTQSHLQGAYGEHYVGKAFLDNLRGALLVFSSTNDKALQYGYKGGGIMDDLTAAALVLGLAVAIPRLGNPAYWPLVLGIVLNWFLGGTLTVNAPRFHRISAMAFLMYLLPALYGREVIRATREAFGRRGMMAASAVVATGLVLVGFLNYRLYFIDYDHQPNHKMEALRTYLALESRDAGPDCVTFAHWGPFPKTLKHQAQLLIAGDRRVEGFQNVEDIRIPMDRKYTKALFLVDPKAESVRKALMKRFPGGVLEEGIIPGFREEHMYDRYAVPLGE